MQCAAYIPQGLDIGWKLEGIYYGSQSIKNFDISVEIKTSYTLRVFLILQVVIFRLKILGKNYQVKFRPC